MTIEQTVEIPADRRISLDLPPELPVGKAKITITSLAEMPAADAYDAVTSLQGLAKKMGSTLTVARFLDMRREDLNMEEEKNQRFFQEKEQ